MKKLSILSLTAIVLLAAPSCKKFTGINQNPNSATTATAEVILPQAITYTAENSSSYNNYGAQLAGYMANAGGYGGFGSAWTYNFGVNDFSGLWSSTFDVLNDFQNVINITANDPTRYAYNAIARIMRAYNFSLLVDAYNNIPYTKSLQGTSNIVNPTYDDAKTVYTSLANDLDSAIAVMHTAETAPNQAPISLTYDPMFGGGSSNETKLWIQFANTIKLRLIVRASGATTFANTTFDSDGFLTSDAIVNPGFAKLNGQENPSWSTWVQHYDGGAGLRDYMPCTYVFGYYDGSKLLDSGRGNVIYLSFPNTTINQMGIGTTAVPSAPAIANAWYSGNTSSLGNAAGIMKGLNMGEPLVMASESYFLQAEAQLRGIIPGSAETSFNNGIEASFNYLFLLPDNKSYGTDAYGNTLDPVAASAQYQTDNSTSYLANYNLAANDAQRLEAIITQKYIAVNFINSQEGWNEYRRTGYPKSANVTGDPYASFASTLSQASRPDKLPTRISYPASEYSYNAANVPSGISVYTSLIFWAK